VSSFVDRLESAMTDEVGDVVNSDPRRPRARTLRQILADPAALELPPPVVPRLVWPGRSTLLSAREKAGKSSFGTAAAVATAGGRAFLSAPAARGAVLWLGFEEHEADIARRFLAHGADDDDDETFVVTRLVDEDPLDAVRRHLADNSSVSLIVVDTLAALARPRAIESGDARGWQGLVQGATDLARDSGAGLLILHHARKAGGFRDSTAIAAAVDVVVEMARGDRLLPTERQLEIVGRFGSETLIVNFEGGRYVLRDDGTDPDLIRTTHEIVTAFIAANPKSSTRAIESGCGCRVAEVRKALSDLVRAGRLMAIPGPRRARLYMISGASTFGSIRQSEGDDDDE
jgi:hypothetical protein